MKILVVDDHPLIVHALSQVLPDLQGDLAVLSAVNRDEPSRCWRGTRIARWSWS